MNSKLGAHSSYVRTSVHNLSLLHTITIIVCMGYCYVISYRQLIKTSKITVKRASTPTWNQHVYCYLIITNIYVRTLLKGVAATTAQHCLIKSNINKHIRVSKIEQGHKYRWPGGCLNSPQCIDPFLLPILICYVIWTGWQALCTWWLCTYTYTYYICISYKTGKSVLLDIRICVTV